MPESRLEEVEVKTAHLVEEAHEAPPHVSSHDEPESYMFCRLMMSPWLTPRTVVSLLCTFHLVVEARIPLWV